MGKKSKEKKEKAAALAHEAATSSLGASGEQEVGDVVEGRAAQHDIIDENDMAASDVFDNLVVRTENHRWAFRRIEVSKPLRHSMPNDRVDRDGSRRCRDSVARGLPPRGSRPNARRRAFGRRRGWLRPPAP